MQITFAVPEAITTRYVVTVDRAPADPSAVVPWRMPHPHRREAAAALGTPRLTITCHPPSRVVVSSTTSPSAHPRAAFLACAAARAIADAYGGVVEDPVTGRTVTAAPEPPPGNAVFPLTDDWLGWHVETPSPRPVHRLVPVRDGSASGPQGGPARSLESGGPCLPSAVGDDLGRHPARAIGSSWSVTTRGLCRFGLPELMLESGAWTHGHHPFGFLRAAAQRLLDEHLAWLAAHPTGGLRTICGHLRVDGRDCVTPRVDHRDAYRLPGRPQLYGAAAAARDHRRSAVATMSRSVPPGTRRYALVRLSLVRMPQGEAPGPTAIRTEAGCASRPGTPPSRPDRWRMERSEGECSRAEALRAQTWKEESRQVTAREDIHSVPRSLEWWPNPDRSETATPPAGPCAADPARGVPVLRIRPPVTFRDDPGGAPCPACAGSSSPPQVVWGRAA